MVNQIATGPTKGRACGEAAGRPRAATGGRAVGLDRKRPGKNVPFIEERCLGSILIISGPSRPQKWMQLEIPVLKMVQCLNDIVVIALDWSLIPFSKLQGHTHADSGENREI